VLASTGQIVVLLNDDVEIVSDDFLVQLAAPLAEDGVGMTGACLLKEDGVILEAGLAIDRRLEHVMSEGRTINAGPFGIRHTAGHRVGSALVVNRETSGVSGACLAITRALYEEVGGLSEEFPTNFADVDLSLKVTGTGRRILWMAHAVAYHFEARTRTPVIYRQEARNLQNRWDLPAHDPYFPLLPESEPRRSGGADATRSARQRPRARWQ
jgi:GT2 family glycosyltransferase